MIFLTKIPLLHICLIAWFVLLFSVSSLAQSEPVSKGLPGSSNDPIEITAQRSLEWHRNANQFIARDKAVAIQGKARVSGDLLVADYRETQESSIDIWQITASGNVEVSNEDSSAFGDKAVYNVETQIATLTGESLKLVSPDQTITATDSFIYHTGQRRASAIGNAKVVRGQDSLSANRIEAVFKESGGNNQDSVDTIEAKTNVVIRTPEETLSGDYAIYRSKTNIAEIIGNVTITKGPNILKGGRAEVDLTSNISKMFGVQETGERVRGVFFPETAPNKE